MASILDNETMGFISNELKSSGLKTMASGFASMANSFINYNALKIEANNLNMQADTIELQAQQRANNLRRQFIGAVGNANYNAAARGVKVTSANLQDNIQRSAGEIDEDIRKNNLNASMRADTLRLQSKITKRNAKAMRFSGLLGGVSDIVQGYNDYNLGKNWGLEDMYGQSSYNPATTAPARKRG